MFLHTFHREASSNIDYQFVYVSKEIKILGTSSYFRFVLSPPLRSLDRKPDTPEIVNDGHFPSILSPRPIDIEKITKSKSIDSILEAHRTTCGYSDQRRRPCRVCHASKFDSSYTANKAQFLTLLNEQLMARVGRLERDLGLTEAALKNEKMARMTLSKKLHIYESFVDEMFRRLNAVDMVKVRDTMKREITIQKVKSKELSSIRDQQGDKSVPIPEVSMFNRSSEYQTYNDEEITETNKTQEILQQPNLSDDFVKVIHNPELMRELFIKDEATMTVDNSEVNSVMGEFVKEMTVPKVEDSDNQRCRTKEETNTINGQGDKVDYKIEENCVQKLNETEDNVDSKEINSNQISAENNLQEWVLEGECYLKMSNRMHQMIDNVERSLKNCLKAQGIHIESDTPKSMDSKNQETPQTSSVLIKCCNAKLSIIK
nr:PREDICTED: uncharacterized protein LOC100878890 [Megachile rotundata]